MDMVAVAKNVVAGMPTMYTKQDFQNEIAKRAELERQPDDGASCSLAN